jgi:arylsulfatase A-like enzyme/cytochrome c-type biogenesis protein CcmH/NrfG
MTPLRAPRALAGAALLLLGAGCGREGETSRATSLPGADVVLVTIDTLRADAVGFAGNRRVATPTLDRLAAAGRVFPGAHAHNVVTLPSHANILTGLYPYQHGVRENAGFVLRDTVPTLATLLGDVGYATGAFVGAFPLDAQYGLARGFDVYDDAFPRGSAVDRFVLAERRGDAVVAPALAWWRANSGQRRFLWVHLYDPHAAYDAPEPFRSRYAADPYLGEVAATDSFLAPLLEPFLGGAEPPALVVVTSDHGEALGDHGELTHGLFAYEPTLAVPLVVWHTGITPGRDERLARHVDIAPTILSALGLDAPENLTGTSLLGPPPEDPTSYFEALTTHLNRGWAPLRGTLRGREKLVELPIPELYDLAADPGEKDNLAGTQRSRLRDLRAALPGESVWPPQQGTVSAEEEARLRSLGYSGGGAVQKAVYTADDDPKTLVALDRQLHQAIDAYSNGRYEDSVGFSRAVVAARPEMAEGYEHLALALRQLERHGEAIAVLRTARERGAVRPSLLRQLGQALAETGEAAEAVAVLAPLAAEPGADAMTLNSYGSALGDVGREQEAIVVLERVAAAHPRDPKAHENLGIILLRLDRTEEARARLETALALNDQLPISWNTLGVALFRLEGPPAALAAWERAVAIDPRQYDALYNLGLVAAQAGRAQQARQALSRFVATAPPERWSAEIRNAEQVLSRLGS